MSKILRPSAHAFRKAGWIAADKPTYDRYIEYLLSGVEKNRTRKSGPSLLPAVQAFKNFIELDPVVFADFIRMFKEADCEDQLETVREGQTAREGQTPKDYNELILMLNEIFREAPKFGSLGPPVYMIMARSMNTQGGFSAYTKENLNLEFKKLFETWSLFLKSKDSREVLNHHHDGWFSSAAKTAMMEEYDGATFEEVFICDHRAPYFGFTSYDDFFNRRFRNPQAHRPTGPIDDLRLVSAACESTSYAYQTDVQRSSPLFIKDEEYSLVHLLANDPQTDEFIGGNILQGFLNTTGYHRWHAPVNGHIRKIVDVPGTYFAQAPSTLNTPPPINSKDDPPTSDGAPPYLHSLRFFANTAARQLMFIEADNPKIGLMCFIAIGMTEISTCQATVYEGQHVVRGDELGMFHFGGSSSALLFRASANIKFDHAAIQPGTPLRINSPIGVAELH